MLWQDAEVKTLCGRILPGLIGAGAFQLNAVVDKAIAAYIGAFAVGSLVYCQHLVYLPIGIFGVATALNGYLFCPINPIIRVLFAAGGLLMLDPSVLTDIIGIVVFAAALGLQFMVSKRRPAAAA